MPDDPAVLPSQAPVPQPPAESDGEIRAMNAVVAALKPLLEEERRRVLEYVLGRFGAVPIQPAVSSFASPVPSAGAASGASSVHHGGGGIHDIRTLKETKAPKSANEMAALVAFFVSELAPADERRNTIAKADIERYFKSAGFNLPADAAFTLVNAKNAGFLDNAGGGQYKLNPVGYNLVAHRMGTREKKASRRPRARGAKRAAAKIANGRRKK
jgi:hypothetical protein